MTRMRPAADRTVPGFRPRSSWCALDTADGCAPGGGSRNHSGRCRAPGLAAAIAGLSVLTGHNAHGPLRADAGCRTTSIARQDLQFCPCVGEPSLKILRLWVLLRTREDPPHGRDPCLKRLRPSGCQRRQAAIARQRLRCDSHSTASNPRRGDNPGQASRDSSRYSDILINVYNPCRHGSLSPAQTDPTPQTGWTLSLRSARSFSA